MLCPLSSAHTRDTRLLADDIQTYQFTRIGHVTHAFLTNSPAHTHPRLNLQLFWQS